MMGDFDKQPNVLSPDGRTSVQLRKNYKFLVIANGVVIKTLDFDDEPESNIEVGWAPDSSQFFISYSDSGAIGGYHVHLYRIEGREVQESAIPGSVAARFKAKHWCDTRGNNLFFLGWSSDSKIGFFVAEVFPTGDCGKELGLVRGYAVNLLDGSVLRVFPKKETNAIEKSCRATGVLALPPK